MKQTLFVSYILLTFIFNIQKPFKLVKIQINFLNMIISLHVGENSITVRLRILPIL